MLKRDLVKLAGGLLLGGMALLPVLTGCGGKTTPPAAAAAASASQPATPAPSTTPPASSGLSDDQLALGKLIFMEKAGGVGCQKCHGVEAKGNKEIGAPDIRGKTEENVRRAMENVELMKIVKLTDEEITAVVGYLQVLNK